MTGVAYVNHARTNPYCAISGKFLDLGNHGSLWWGSNARL